VLRKFWDPIARNSIFIIVVTIATTEVLIYALLVDVTNKNSMPNESKIEYPPGTITIRAGSNLYQFNQSSSNLQPNQSNLQSPRNTPIEQENKLVQTQNPQKP
jgi:hypothetical protein